MTISLVAKELTSRAIRSNVVNGKTGLELFEKTEGERGNFIRVINNLTDFGQEDEKGIVNQVLSKLKKFVGWIDSAIDWIILNARKIWGWLTNGIEQLKSFNWNATDQELKASIAQNNIRLAGIWGGLAGQAVGWLGGAALGYGISMVVPVIGGAFLARYVTGKVLKEAAEELLPQLGNAIVESAKIMATAGLVYGYIGVRSWIKKLDRATLAAVVGTENANWIKDRWGAEGEPDLSFNSVMDEQVEKIKNPYLQAFTEEFLEESWDGFVEAGFVVAEEIAEQYANAKSAIEDEAGPERDLIIYPDKETTDEAIIIDGLDQKEAIQMAQTSLNNYRHIYNRDIGEWVGDRYEEALKAKPKFRNLRIEWHERPHPPWRLPNGERGISPYCNIPNPKPNLRWREIKLAAKPFTWGPWKATAYLSSRREMAVWGASEQEAINKLKELVDLSTDEITGLYCSQEIEKPRQQKKVPTLVYPKQGVLRQKQSPLYLNDPMNFNKRLFDKSVEKFALWLDNEPSDFPDFGYVNKSS